MLPGPKTMQGMPTAAIFEASVPNGTPIVVALTFCAAAAASTRCASAALRSSRRPRATSCSSTIRRRQAPWSGASALIAASADRRRPGRPGPRVCHCPAGQRLPFGTAQHAPDTRVNLFSPSTRTMLTPLPMLTSR